MEQDLSNLSDRELMALLNSGQQVQPTNAATGQALNPAQSQGVQQYAAAGGFDPQAEAGSARKPFAQTTPGQMPDPGKFYFDTEGRVKQAPDDGGLARALDDRVRATGRGFPVLGAFADEANAATAAALAPMLEPALRRAPEWVKNVTGYDEGAEVGDLPTFRQRYEAAQNLQRFRDESFDSEHPKESMALQVAGGLVPTLMTGLMAPGVIAPATTAAGPEAGLLLRSLTGATEGAAIAGAHGYGMGYGDFSDPSRLNTAGGAALLGGAGGAALPIVSRVAGTAWRSTGGRLADAIRGERAVQEPANDAAERLSRILREEDPQTSAMKPDRADLESGLVTAERSPLVTRASNVDDAYVRIARALDRQKMTPAEAADQVQGMGPFGSLADTGESTRDLLRAAINRPGRGATIAQENLGPRQSGVFDPDAGQWTVRPSSTRITDQAQTGLGLGGKEFYSELDTILAQRKADSGPAYAKAYAAAPADIGEFRDFAGSKLFRDAYGRARAISEKEFVTLPDGTEQIIPLPERLTSNEALDWRTLDLMKQGLDDLVKEGKVQGIGANDQGATKGYLSRFVAKLDSLNPDYKAARDAYSGPTSMKEALEEGRSLLNEDAPLVAANLNSRSESERQMMRLGALQALQTKLGNANVTFDAANQAGLLKPNQLARFKALFPDAKSFADFYRTLANEKTMFGTNTAAFGNSTTAKQLLNVMEPSDPQIEGMTQVVPAAAGGNIIGLVRAIHRMGMESPMREGVAETISSVLSGHNAEQMPEIVRRLEEARRRAEVADVIRRTMGSGSGAAAGQASQPGQ